MIEIRHATFRYPGQTDAALCDVTLGVAPAEAIGIVGPNGSGKSTLGRLIKGLLLPSPGQVLVDSLDTGVDGLEVRRRVGLVFQNPNSQIVNSVVEQEVAFGPENLGLPSAEIRERVDSALQAVGLQHRKTAECHALSMANKQRVAIAAVMAMHPRHLVLDEPTAWIEPSARWPLFNEVLRWSSTREVTVVLITHRMDEAQLCSRLYGMLDGKMEISGTPEEVLQNQEACARLALEVPETLLLARELEAAGLPVDGAGGVDRMAEVICRS